MHVLPNSPRLSRRAAKMCLVMLRLRPATYSHTHHNSLISTVQLLQSRNEFH